jgi:hypothetical protein
VAIAASTMTAANSRRPPNWSDQAPRAIRDSEPVRIGVPIRRPNWVSESPSSCLMSRPMIAKIVQTAKQAVKATVLVQSAWPAPSAGRSRVASTMIAAAAMGRGDRGRVPLVAREDVARHRLASAPVACSEAASGLRSSG